MRIVVAYNVAAVVALVKTVKMLVNKASFAIAYDDLCLCLISPVSKDCIPKGVAKRGSESCY